MPSPYISEYKNGNANVGVAAVAIGSAGTVVASNGSPRKTIRVWNRDAAVTLYMAASSAVTTATGFPVDPLTYVDLDDGGRAQWYGIAASTIDVRWLEAF